MNGLGDHDHRRPAAEAVRLLDRRRRLRRRGAGVRRRGFDERNATALVLGLATLAVLLVLPRLTTTDPGRARRGRRRHRRHRPCSTSTVEDRRVRSRRACPGPRCRGPSVDDVGPMLVAAVGITLVSLTDTIATSTSFAARRGDEVDPNQEMIGIGTANIAAGFFQGFAVSTSGSRTAVAEQSGAKSQLTGLVGAGIVALLLLFFSSLLADLPQTALAAVVIAAALSLADLGDAPPRTARVRRVSLRAVAGGHRRRRVLRRAAGHRHRHRAVDPAVLPAQLVAPRRGARPGRRRRRAGTASTPRPAPSERPGVLVFRWEAPLFFANAGMFRQQVRRLVRERQPRWVVLQCEAITDIDVTAADMLEQLDTELNAHGRPHRVRRAAHPAAGPRLPLRPVRDARPRPLLRLDRRGPRSDRCGGPRRRRDLTARDRIGVVRLR